MDRTRDTLISSRRPERTRRQGTEMSRNHFGVLIAPPKRYGNMRMKYGMYSTSLLAVFCFKKLGSFVKHISVGKTYDSSFENLVEKKIKDKFYYPSNTGRQKKSAVPKNIRNARSADSSSSCNQYSLGPCHASTTGSSNCRSSLSESFVFNGRSTESHDSDRKFSAGSSVITSQSIQISKETNGTEYNGPDSYLSEPYHSVMVESEAVRFCKIAESCVVELLNQKEYEKCFLSVQEFFKNKQCPSFKTLHRLVAHAGTSGNVTYLNDMKSVAEKVYPRQYLKKLHFNHYLVNALFKSGRTKDALDLIEELYKKHPRNTKKIKDITKFFINDIFIQHDEELKNQVVKFVLHIAQTLNQVAPAVDCWRAAFCSSNHNHHQSASYLLKEIPGLHHLIEQKLEGIVNSARNSGNPDVLQRLVHLSLEWDLMQLCEDATGALLTVQCEIGDIISAGETIRFAQHLKFVLKTENVQCFLGLLNQHKKQVPFSLLAMKYARPSQSQPSPAKARPNVPQIQFKW